MTLGPVYVKMLYDVRHFPRCYHVVDDTVIQGIHFCGHDTVKMVRYHRYLGSETLPMNPTRVTQSHPFPVYIVVITHDGIFLLQTDVTVVVRVVRWFVAHQINFWNEWW